MGAWLRNSIAILALCITASITPQSCAGDKLAPGDEAEMGYVYEYNGFIVKGKSKFVFTVKVIEFNSNKTQALVKVTNIRRYWNNDIREKDIKSMPFEDPRGYRTYNAPTDWGKSVTLGDTTWVDSENLYKKVSLKDK